MNVSRDESQQLISIQELSKRSGVPVVTLRRWARAGSIPFFQPGGKNGRLLFPVDAIEASYFSHPTSECATPRAGRLPGWMK